MTLLTSLADRYCSHASAPKLRPFDEGDWMAFAGCESEFPEIGSTDTIVVVLDGNCICVDLPVFPEKRLDVNHRSDLFIAEFADEAEARAVALFLLGNPRLTPRVLGDSVGTC